MGIPFLACPPVTELTPSVKQRQDRSIRCQTGREAASLRLEPGEYGLTSVLNG